MIGGLYNYWIAIALMMIGFYGVIAKRNLLKQAIALGLFQTGVFLFYVSMGVIDGGTAPVWAPAKDEHGHYVFDEQGELVRAYNEGTVDHPLVSPAPEHYRGRADNPLVHVLILTAIVVSVSTLAVAVAIIINIKRSYGSIEEDDIRLIDGDDAPSGATAGDAQTAGGSA